MSEQGGREAELIPDAWDEYRECEDCEVTVHGPQKPGSPGGAHATFCDEHANTDGEEYSWKAYCDICKRGSAWHSSPHIARGWRELHFESEHPDNPMKKTNCRIKRDTKEVTDDAGMDL